MATALLDIRSLSISFGGLKALSSIDLTLSHQDLVGVIGPNGAGKTTAFNIITGHYAPDEGEILLEGKSILGLSPSLVTKRGIARTFQNIRLFKNLTVLDNIRIAIHSRTKSSVWHSVWRSKNCRIEEESILQQAHQLLDIFKLSSKALQQSKNLPYGDQRKLEMARALATSPKLLLLDEPAAGMNSQETAKLTELIYWIREKFKVGILLIEHDMELVMRACQTIFVLNYGQLIAKGSPKEIRSNQKVVQAYLGGTNS